MPPDADRAQSAAPTEKRIHYLAILLAILAGFVDATGFMQLGGTFVSFMSGNSTRLAVSFALASRAGLLTALVVGAFVAGVMGGSLLSSVAPVRRKPLVLLAAALTLACAALVQAFGWKVPAVVVMAAAMGSANNVFRSEDGPYNIGVTYMTGNLVKFAEGLAGALIGRKRAWLPYLALWLGLLIGAAAGASLFRQIGMNNLWVAAAAGTMLAFAAREVKSPPMEDWRGHSGH